MAGSKVVRSYTDDTGKVWNCLIDETNAEILGFGAFSATANQLPNYIGKRYVLGYFPASPNIRRKYWVGSLDTWGTLRAMLVPGCTIEKYPGNTPELFNITYFGGETLGVVTANDTGINDGDNP